MTTPTDPIAAMNAQPAREGDIVKHLPSGETWVVAGVYDNGDILCAGWPCSLARVGEYEVTKRCSDAKHQIMLKDCSEIQPDYFGHDPRKSLALSKLEKARTAPTPTKAEGKDDLKRPLKIYVASSWRNTFQPDVVKLLREDGHEVYDFKDEDGFHWTEVDPSWKDWPNDIPKYLAGLNNPCAIRGFNRDMMALRECDVCVYVMPCGVSASLEAGWAAGAGRKTIVYVPGLREPDLMVKMADVVTGDLGVVREAVKSAKHRPHLAQPDIVEKIKARIEKYDAVQDDVLAPHECIEDIRRLLSSPPSPQAPSSDRELSAPLAIPDNDGVTHPDVSATAGPGTETTAPVPASDKPLTFATANLMLEHVESIMWMAEKYAEGGGSHGPEMEEFTRAKEEVEQFKSRVDALPRNPQPPQADAKAVEELVGVLRSIRDSEHKLPSGLWDKLEAALARVGAKKTQTTEGTK